MILKFKDFIIETECKITHFYSGQIELKFELNQNTFLKCETPFETLDNQFIIKQIDDNEVTAELDFTSLKNEIITNKYDSSTLGELLDHIYVDWTISNAHAVTIRRTLEVEELNKYQMLERIASLYKCTFEFNIKEKRIKVITIGNDRTDYIINDIDYQIKSDTYNHFTKIIGYGKDNMTIAEINDGSPFLENFTYNQNEILYLFRDDRFEDKESLKAKMQELLNENCKPFYEYQIEASTNSNLKLHDEILFFNDKLKIREKHRIIETVLEDGVLTIKLANRTTSVVEYMHSTIESSIRESAAKQINFFTNAITESNNKWNEYLTSGHTIVEKNAIYFVDKLPKEEAVNVLKIGLGGIQASTNGFNGNYNNVAINLDGSINADLIRVGKISGDRIATNTITTSHLAIEAKEELINEFTNSNTVKQLIVNTTTDGITTTIRKYIEDNKEELKGKDGKDAVILSPTAPEDTSRSWIDTLSNQLKIYQNGNWVVVNNAKEITDYLSNRLIEIEGLITDKKDIELLKKEFESSKMSFENYRDLANGRLDALRNQYETAIQKAENIEKIITQDADGISITSSNSTIKTTFDNDGMAWYDNNVKVAFISNQRLFINSGVFVSELIIARHKFTTLENVKGTVMIYIGEGGV